MEKYEFTAGKVLNRKLGRWTEASTCFFSPSDYYVCRMYTIYVDIVFAVFKICGIVFLIIQL